MKMEKNNVFLICMVVLFFSVCIHLSLNSTKTHNNLRSYQDNSSNSGVYIPSEKVIMLFMDNWTIKQVQITANHEICHYIWINYLSFLDKAEYYKIYKNSREFVTKYAKTEHEEDFAEHCAFWSYNLNISLEREIFFNETIKRYFIK